MKKNNIYKLFIILLIIFFVSFFSLAERKLYFNLVGNNYIEMNIDDKYSELGYSANICNKYIKIFCKNVTKDVTIKKIHKDNKILINYIINFKNKVNILTREIIFKDLESPTIKLNDNLKNVNLCPNDKYIDPGVTAFDNVDGDITDKVEIKTLHNKIYYTATDSSGNKKITFRNIKYFDSEIPKIILKGSKKIYVFKDNKYIEKGFTATDNCDGNLTDKVNINSTLNTSKVGNYKINYSVYDSFGNENSLTREVIVYDDISNVKKNGKIVYLTFDDGPASYTDEILDVLKKYNVKATFFVTNQFSSYQYVMKREYEEGHTVAVHTYSHNYKKIYSSVEDYLLDFDNINQIIFEQTGEYSNLFRFPGGSSNTISKFNRGIMTELDKKTKELDYIYFDWNVDSMDTSEKDPNKIANNVLKGIEENEKSIVLLHDIKKANIESVDKIISQGLEKGYTFLPLDENSFVYQHKINN